MQTRAIQLPTFTKEHSSERVILRILLSALAIFIISYVYLIGASTFHIIARKQAESSSISVQSALAQINAEYYTLAEGLTEGRARALGLTNLQKKEYVTRAVYLGYIGDSVR